MKNTDGTMNCELICEFNGIIRVTNYEDTVRDETKQNTYLDLKTKQLYFHIFIFIF